MKREAIIDLNDGVIGMASCQCDLWTQHPEAINRRFPTEDSGTTQWNHLMEIANDFIFGAITNERRSLFCAAICYTASQHSSQAAGLLFNHDLT